MSGWIAAHGGADHERRSAIDAPRMTRVLIVSIVDRLVEGAAHADVLERILALDVAEEELVALLVHAEEDRPQLRTLKHAEAARRLDALDVLQRHRLHHVDLAGEQAATRVASLPIGVKTISSMLLSTLPQ